MGGEEEKGALLLVVAQAYTAYTRTHTSIHNHHLHNRLRRVMKEEWGNPVVILASQRPLLAAYADQVAILDDGRVLQYGSPQQIVPSPLLGPASAGAQPQQRQPRRTQQPRGQGQQQPRYPAGGAAGPASSSSTPAAAAAASMPAPRTRGVRWGGGSTTSNSDDETEVYLFDREG